MDTKTLDDTYFDGQLQHELQHGDAKYIWSLESELSPFTTNTVSPLILSAVVI